MSQLQCNLCPRTFSSKEKLDHHRSTCIWMHTSKKIREEEIESIEPPFTDRQRDKILRDLLHQNQALNTKLEKMQIEMTKLKKTQRINILTWLNAQQSPKQTITEWIRNISISQLHLEYVFQYDLISGMKLCLQDTITTSNMLQKQMPICAFTQKQKTLFVYRTNNGENKWEMMDKNITLKILQSLATRFLQIFLQWQMDNDAFLQTEKGQEKDMVYMKKVMGENVCENARAAKLSAWFYQVLNVDQTYVPVVY